MKEVHAIILNKRKTSTNIKATHMYLYKVHKKKKKMKHINFYVAVMERRNICRLNLLRLVYVF